MAESIYPDGPPENLSDEELLADFDQKVKAKTQESKEFLDRFFGMLEEHRQDVKSKANR